MDDKEKEKKEAEVMAVLRSVVQSAKGGVLISNLQSEYEFLVGHKVPFRDLGYCSLEEMLRSTPDIVKISRNSHGQPVVNAVADESTAHIASLISRQKNARTRRMPRRRPAAGSHYSKPQTSQYLPRMNVKKQHPNSSSRPPRFAQNNAPSQKIADVPPPVPRKASGGRRQPPSRPPPRLPPRLQAQWQSSQSFGALHSASQEFLLKQSLPDSPPVTSPPVTPPPPQCFSPNLLPSTSPIPPLLTSSEYSALISSDMPPPLTTPISPSPPLYCRSPSYDVLEVNNTSSFHHEAASYRDIIDAYAASKGLKVTYRSLPLNPREIPRTYVSTLMIAKQKFNSYPNDMPTIEQAEEEAARVAVEALDLLAGKNSERLPTSCMDTAERKKIILKRILKIIDGKTNGLWSMKVESVYRETYNEVLPSNWLEIISSDINVHRVGPNRCILYPIQRNHLFEDEEDIQEAVLPEPLSLPESECWDVFVSYLTSSVDVCIQLVDNSHLYQTLGEQMQAYYENNGTVARLVEEGRMYAVKNEDYWHRVRVTNIMGDKVECYFVDHGDSEITEKSSLCDLLPSFAQLPFQALHCQLDGLTEYADNKIMLHHLTDKNVLLGKTLVAKVVSREDPVSLVFYDTSTDEDININEHLLKITEKEYITPKMPKSLSVSDTKGLKEEHRRARKYFPTVGGITKAYLSHVDRNGDVYVRVIGPALELLRILLDEFSVQSKTELECVTSVSNSEMYCVRYMADWYRAIVKTLPVGDLYKEVEMLFVDYGNCITVPMTAIYELGQLSDELTGLPFQALKCHLHGLTPAANEEWSKQTIKQLLRLAPENQILLLKVVTAATEDHPTTVEIFKRIEPNDELVSINQTIAMSDSIISIKENGLLKSKRMEDHRLPPLNLTLEFLVDQIPSKVNITSPANFVPSQEETKLPKWSAAKKNVTDIIKPYEFWSKRQYSVITPDGIGEQVDNVLELPVLVPAEIPEAEQYFDVHVVNAAHPFNFIVQPYKEGIKLEILREEMQQFYSSEENTIDMDKCLLKCGQFYAGKNQKNEWHRVCVQNIFDDDEMVSAYFVDFGGYSMIALSDLQPLWKYFRSLPFQAIRAKLYGIAPLHDDWNANDCCQFQKLVEKKEFVSVIKAKKVDPTISFGGQELTLVLFDTSGPDDININHHLVELKIAVYQGSKR